MREVAGSSLAGPILRVFYGLSVGVFITARNYITLIAVDSKTTSIIWCKVCVRLPLDQLLVSKSSKPSASQIVVGDYSFRELLGPRGQYKKVVQTWPETITLDETVDTVLSLGGGPHESRILAGYYGLNANIS